MFLRCTRTETQGRIQQLFMWEEIIILGLDFNRGLRGSGFPAGIFELKLPQNKPQKNFLFHNAKLYVRTTSNHNLRGELNVQTLHTCLRDYHSLHRCNVQNSNLSNCRLADFSFIKIVTTFSIINDNAAKKNIIAVDLVRGLN